jgi:hypothetical protein
MPNLFLLIASRLFTKKRVLTMNHRDVLIAEGLENSKETTITEAVSVAVTEMAAEEASAATVIDGN